MKAITKIKDLEGKTIKRSTDVDCGESMALIFTDGSYAFFDVTHYGGSYDMFLNDNPEYYLQRDAGIITEEKYNEIKRAENKARAERIKKQELNQLEQLKAKYDKAN